MVVDFSFIFITTTIFTKIAKYRKMGRIKGTVTKAGGRKKGTCNKVTSDVKSWIKLFIDGKRDQFEDDFMKVDAGTRLVIMERLLKFVTPTLASVSIEEQIRAEYIELKNLFNQLPDEAITAIANKVVTLKEQSKTLKK